MSKIPIEEYDDLTDAGFDQPVQMIGDERPDADIIGLTDSSGNRLYAEDGDWSKEWTNYWDATPQGHGGAFVKRKEDGGGWVVVFNYPPNEAYIDEETLDKVERNDEYAWLIQRIEVSDYEVWRNGEPHHGFKAPVREEVSAMSDSPATVVDTGFVEQAVAHRIARRVYGRRNRGEIVTGDEGDYWEHMEENYGITPEHA